MGTTKDNCRYVKATLDALTVGAIDLRCGALMGARQNLIYTGGVQGEVSPSPEALNPIHKCLQQEAKASHNLLVLKGTAIGGVYMGILYGLGTIKIT